MLTLKAARIASAVIAVALLAGCASPGSSSVQSPPATAASVQSPSATAATRESAAAGESAAPVKSTCPNPHGGSCLGPLEAGEYSTTRFKPGITYTVPDGWTNFEDLPGNVLLFQQEDSQDGVVGGSYLGIYSNVRAAAIDCAEAAQEAIGATPAELVAWYQSVPGLAVSEPTPVSVGGLDGLQIDLSLVPRGDTCSYGPYSGLPLIIGDGVSELHHVVLDEIGVRLVMLEWGKGNLTLEITNVTEQHSAEEFRSQVQPIVDSLVFDG
jgi:hypothetical protein